MSDVVVVSSDDSNEESAGEAIAEAIDQAVEVEQSFDIGLLAGRLEAMEARVQMHDDLINLHSHEGFVERADLMDCEERMASRIDAVSVPEVEAEIAEPTPEVVEQSNDNSTEEPTNNDTPPKSRKKRKSFAERYYG